MLKKIIAGLLIYTLAVTQVIAQTATLVPNAKQTFLGTTGAPLASGSVTMYVPNSTNKKTTWLDAYQASNNTNPIALDAAGRAVIFGQGNYRQVVKDKNGVTIWDSFTSAVGSAVPSGATGTDTAPIGSMLPWASFTVPTNWAWANGQTVLRADYPDLLTAITISYNSVSCASGSPTLSGWPDTTQIKVGSPIEATCIPTGTTVKSIVSSSSITVSNNAVSTATVTATVFPWGNGNEVSTFNLPDLRGRSPIGADTMNATAANRLQITTTINTINASATASIPTAAGAYRGMTVVSANVPAGTTISTVNSKVSTTIITTSGSTSATVGSAAGLIVGMTISAPTITPGTTISAISGTTITLSAAAITLPGIMSTSNGRLPAYVSNTAGLKTGMGISGTGITGGTTISALSGNLITLSTGAASTVTNTVVAFSGTTDILAGVFSSVSNMSVTLSANATATATATVAVLRPVPGVNTAGAGGGSASHIQTLSELVSHSHSITASASGVSQYSTGASAVGGSTYPTASNGTGTLDYYNILGIVSATESSTGGGTPFTVLNPYLTVNYIIKIKLNTSGAGGVVSWGGLFGDIATDATLQGYIDGGVNYAGIADADNLKMLANVSGGSAQPTPTSNTEWLDATCGSTQGMIIYRGTSTWDCLSPPAIGPPQGLTSSGLNPSWAAAGTGSVTSVGLALPSIFAISGSPVTSSGTLTGTLTTQIANTAFMGPVSGSAAIPTFRAFVSGDFSAGVIPASALASTAITPGAYGSATASPTFTVDAQGRLTAAANVTITPAIGSITGLGTGAATALGINVGSAGAFVTFNGAGGTPSSMTGTNITGTAAGLTAGNVTTNANLTGPISSIGNTTSITSQTGTGTKFVVDTGPTIAGLTATGSFTATGLVTNADLVNPATTVNGQACTLGSTCTVAAAAGTLTGSTLAAGVTASSLTSVGALAGGSATTGFTIVANNVTLSGQFPGTGVAVVGDASGAPSATFGVLKADGTTIQCISGTCSAVGAVASSIGVGTTTVTGGTAGHVLINGTTLNDAATTALVFGTGTLNLSGNLTTTGAFNPTFSIPASVTYAFPPIAATLSYTIASGSKALATSAISSAACTAAQTATATGTATTDIIEATFNGDPTATTGYVALTSGMLTIVSYPTANTVNFKVCNNTGASITPGAITLNWRVMR